MPNQMIALQARNPQIADPSRQTAQFANMMNMARQYEAAQLQAQQAQQTMEFARNEEGREASKDQIENAGKLIDLYTKRAGQTMNAQGYELLLRDMDRDAPDFAATFRANLPPEQFDRNTLLKMVGSVSDNFRATYGPLETEVVQMEDGTFAVTRTGGFDKPGVFELEEYKLNPGGGAPSAPPSAAPPVAQGANARPTQGAPTTQRDLMEQGVDSRNIPAGNPLKPISMTGGAQPNLAGVVESMMSSGQISQSNLQLMRDAAGPDKDAQLAQILKSNNIQIVPDAQASTRNAVFRPGEDTAPQMQMVQNMGDYRATGRPARGKPLMQSPMPGSAIVPLPRVAAEARAGRETPAEAAAKAAAVARANATVETEMQQKGLLKTLDLFGYNPKTGKDSVSALIKASTSGGLEKIGSDLAGFFGEATPGRVAIGQLETLKDNMTFEKLRGKLGAQISDADVRLIASTMGDIANPNTPANERLAKWQNIVLPMLVRGAGLTPVKRGGKQAETEAALPRVRSEADFMRLKPGALFIDPDGQKRRKP